MKSIFGYFFAAIAAIAISIFFDKHCIDPYGGLNFLLLVIIVKVDRLADKIDKLNGGKNE